MGKAVFRLLDRSIHERCIVTRTRRIAKVYADFAANTAPGAWRPTARWAGTSTPGRDLHPKSPAHQMRMTQLGRRPGRAALWRAEPPRPTRLKLGFANSLRGLTPAMIGKGQPRGALTKFSILHRVRLLTAIWQPGRSAVDSWKSPIRRAEQSVRRRKTPV